MQIEINSTASRTDLIVRPRDIFDRQAFLAILFRLIKGHGEIGDKKLEESIIRFVEEMNAQKVYFVAIQEQNNALFIEFGEKVFIEWEKKSLGIIRLGASVE